MSAGSGALRRVGIRADAGTRSGVGHLIRCVALAEELRSRGTEVTFLGDVGGLAWAERQLTARGLPIEPAPGSGAELRRAADRLALDALVLDSYELEPGYADDVRSGRPVLAVVDDDLKGIDADLYLDQNLGAELAAPPLPAGARRLAGVRYALLRDAVRSLRPAAPRQPDPVDVPAVLAFFGGTDAFGAAPTILRLLAATGRPFAATLVAARPEIRAGLGGVALAARQSVELIDPTDDLPLLATRADLVITASGTSTWELLCLGVPTALIWVADNQEPGFRRTTEAGLAGGLGRLDDLRGDRAPAERATAELAQLLTDPQRRAALSARGWATVDGHGRERVADALAASQK